MEVYQIFIALLTLHVSLAILYPYESETREVKSLDGLWKFKISPAEDQNMGFKDLWFARDFTELGDYIEMPVPSSYNDITTNKTIRDCIGWVWYQREVFVPLHWQKRRIFLHFGSVHYTARMWVGGKEVGRHKGGHLPFDLELSSEILQYGSANTIVVASNSTLTNHTIPQGFVRHTGNQTDRYPPGYVVYSHDFDYFDYAGINREVLLYTTPLKYIQDIAITTDIEHDLGIIEYNVTVSGEPGKNCAIEVKDKRGKTVSKGRGCSGKLVFHNVQPWWPLYARKSVGYLYSFEVNYNDGDNNDLYRLPVGIRTLEWNETKLLINGEAVYLAGFGMHEDSHIRGRGIDLATMARDFALIDWIGANAVRTSHYPYSDQFLQQADKTGLLVILESPACSLSNFDQDMLNNHTSLMKEIIERDRNHPSIIMWSLANEPNSNHPQAEGYFKNLVEKVKLMDPTRPVTFVTSQQIKNEKAVQHVDIISVNRYSGWYQDGGRPELIPYQVITELLSWHENYNKPVLITEYGAGSIPGLHNMPPAMWSESYQHLLLVKHFEAFDVLMNTGKPFLIGDMIWNFIDFNTPQEYIRPGRCAKGLFTRERQPKMSAFVVRARLAKLLKQSSVADHSLLSSFTNEDDLHTLMLDTNTVF